ncbi:MAG: hypothetical protein OXC26_02890, partial [Albidovulum sp.]|nr:hypothetical protein [Albidovulum sp.]
ASLQQRGVQAGRSARWIHVGAAKCRGRNDLRRECQQPWKDIWLKPLRKDWKRVHRRTLNHSETARLLLKIIF